MLALLCGGQGTLSDKIFDLVADQPAAEPVFAAATACLGEDPRKLVRTQGTDELSANHVSQILTVTSALAIHGCIADLLTEQTAVMHATIAHIISSHHKRNAASVGVYFRVGTGWADAMGFALLNPSYQLRAACCENSHTFAKI